MNGSPTLRHGRGARLVPAVAAAWTAAAVAVLAPQASIALGAALWALTTGGMLALTVRRRRGAARPRIAVIVLLVAAAAAAATTTTVGFAAAGRSTLDQLTGGVRAVTIEATVVGRVGPGPSGDAWFDVTAHRVTVGGREVVGDAPARVGVAAADLATLRGVDLGTRIAVRGVALPPDPGDRAAVVVRAADGVTVQTPAEGGWRVLADVRASLARSASSLPGPGAALVPGLAVGDTSAVDGQLDGAMKESSLSHLTAVSGANCAIVVGLAFALAAWCGARRGVRVAAGLTALAAFVLLVTPEPSVVRAGTMAAIAMLAVALGRTGAGLSVLSAAVVVLLVLDPWLALSLGFALSSVATAALLLLARPLASGMQRVLPRALALAVAVPLAAQLACAPLLVLVDPRVPLLGVVANMLAAPAAAPATIAGFAACLAAPLPPLQDGLTALAWVPATWIAGVAATTAGIPAQSLPWMEGWLGALSLAAVCACATLVIVLRPGGSRSRRMLRAGALAAVAVLVGTAGAQTALRTVAGGWTVPPTWQIAMCDIGQGDAVLVRSAGSVALFDTGPEPEPLRACLERFGIERVDLLVLTHFDLDHIGGAAAIIGRADAVVHGPTDGADAQGLLDDLAEGGASLTAVSAGDTGTLGAARWRVLWPAASVDIPGNDASVVLEVAGDDVPRTLLLGDLSAEPQARLRESTGAGYDVVKVAHHGSADQDPALYDRVDAAIGLVPVGAGNDYGHPRASLLSILQAEGTTVARSDTDGAVAVWKDGGGLHLWRERGAGGPG